MSTAPPTTPAQEKKPSPAMLRFLLVILFLDSAGVGLILPVLPKLIEDLSGLGNADVTAIGGWIYFAYAVMQFFSAPLLGGISDQFGRRPVLIVALFGLSLDYLLMAFAPTLAFLFLARLIAGIFGATYTAVNAAIVDTTDEQSRAKYFGWGGAVSGIGLIFGPVLGGLLGAESLRLPFIIAGMAAFAAAVYGWFMFTETLAPENKRPFSLKRANPIGSLISIARNPSGGRQVSVLLLSFFIIYLANMSYITMWPFFTIEVFNWGTFMIGISVAFYGICMALVQGVLTGPVVKRIGEARAVAFGFFMAVISYILIGFVSFSPFPQTSLFIIVVLGAFGGFLFPAMQALMSKATPANAQGELQGAISCCYSISSIIGPVIMATALSTFSDDIGLYLPGAPFLLGAILSLTALLVFKTVEKQFSKNRTD